MNALVEFLLWQSLALTVLLSGALLTLARTREVPPRVHHRVLTSAMILALGASCLRSVLPALEIGLPSTTAESTPAGDVPALVLALGSDTVPDARPAGSASWLSHGFAWVWVIGTCFSIVRLARAGAALRLLRSRTNFPADLECDLARCAHAVGLASIPPIGIGPSATAMAVGLWRPWIVLPVRARDWSTDRVRSVLLHELAHVQHGDVRWRAAFALVNAVHWWNPVVRASANALERAQEYAADDSAVRAGRAPVAYASDLLAVATRAAGVGSIAAHITRSSGLERRLRRLVEPQRFRRSRVQSYGLALSAVAALLATPLTLGATSSLGSLDTSEMRRPMGLSVDRHGRIVGGHGSDGDEFWVWISDRGAISFAGPVRFTKSFVALGPGGYLLLELRREQGYDRVEYWVDDDRELHVQRSIDGLPAEVPSGGTEWLDAHLDAGLAALPARYFETELLP